MKKILITTVFLCALASVATAQNLYVQPIGGEQVAFAIANQPKITFAGRTMTVATQTASPQQFALGNQPGNVQNLSFVKNETDPPTSIAMTMEDNGIRLYPNPVDDLLTLEILNPTPNTTYRIFDVNGVAVGARHASPLQGTTTQINMSSFRPGAYILTIDREGLQIQSFRIIKQ